MRTMICTIIATVLELCLALMTSASVIKRYQDYPLQVCPINAVCAEIYSIPSQGIEASYLKSVQCKCPAGLYCPSEPGPQTLTTDSNRWYGMCQQVDELPRCQRGEVAEEIRVNARDFGGRTYTKISCTCPRHEREELFDGNAATLWSETTSGSSEAKTIYHLMCNEGFMSKRGRYGGSRSRGRFYFYKK